VECLPALLHDPNRPEDMLKVDAHEDGVGGLLPLLGASDNPGEAAEEVGGFLAEKRAFFYEAIIERSLAFCLASFICNCTLSVR